MGVVAAVAGLAGAAVNAVGSIEAGNAQSADDKYKAQVARNNAIIEQQNAAWAIQSGETAAVNEGLRTRAKIGTQKAAQGASGIDVNTGSAAAVRAGTESLGMLDAMTIRSNAARQAYGYEVQGVNDTAQAQLDESAAKQATIGGDLGAAGSLLSGVSSVGKEFAGFSSGAPS